MAIQFLERLFSGSRVGVLVAYVPGADAICRTCGQQWPHPGLARECEILHKTHPTPNLYVDQPVHWLQGPVNYEGCWIVCKVYVANEGTEEPKLVWKVLLKKSSDTDCTWIAYARDVVSP
jgi:hypothetical protein